jgi:hypothetical protein
MLPEITVTQQCDRMEQSKRRQPDKTGRNIVAKLTRYDSKTFV